MQYDNSGRVRRRPLLHLVRLTVERRGQTAPTHFTFILSARAPAYVRPRVGRSSRAALAETPARKGKREKSKGESGV